MYEQFFGFMSLVRAPYTNVGRTRANLFIMQLFVLYYIYTLINYVRLTFYTRHESYICFF